MSSKAEYLKRYLSQNDGDSKKKKKKSKAVDTNSTTQHSRMKIVEDDAFIEVKAVISTRDEDDDEERPVVRLHNCSAEELRLMGKFRANTFQPIAEESEWRGRVQDRLAEREKDARAGGETRGARPRHDSSSDDDDETGEKERSRENKSNKSNRPSDVDNSPPRRRGARTSDDLSPPRRAAPADLSPPRRRDAPSSRDRDSSPPRKRERDSSPPRKRERDDEARRTDSRTLDGKRAGLQTAASLREETRELKAKEKTVFSQLDDEVSGRRATTIRRSRQTGKRGVDVKEEEAKKEREKQKQEELDAKYKVWNRGIAQLHQRDAQLTENARVAAEAFARAADDDAMNAHLKSLHHKDDPMLAYIKKKKEKSDADAGRTVYPRYTGPRPAPNRFGIEPGYRWDGVDRGTGFEARLFASSNNRKANEDEFYKWSAGSYE